MGELVLVIGNKNYSTWSLRPWLAMTAAGIPFTERLLPMFDENWAAAIAAVTKARKVPVLIDGDVTVWDTFAFIEYLNERFPEAGLWPEDATARAVARSVAAEMHSGFQAMRGALPMNIRRTPALPPFDLSDAIRADIARVQEIWRDCRAEYGAEGPFLFGAFSAADAFYAPVTRRFLGLQVDMDDTARAYCDAISSLPAMQKWTEAALKETWIVEEDEVDLRE